MSKRLDNVSTRQILLHTYLRSILPLSNQPILRLLDTGSMPLYHFLPEDSRSGVVKYKGQKITVRWNSCRLPRVKAHKACCERLCVETAVAKGYQHVIIRSIVHNTTNAGRGVYVPDDFHITVDFGNNAESTAHIYCGPVKEPIEDTNFDEVRIQRSGGKETIKWWDNTK